MTNQNSDQLKLKLTLTSQNLNSLSMWRVYNLHHTSVFTYSHANTPLGQSDRAYYLMYTANLEKVVQLKYTFSQKQSHLHISSFQFSHIVFKVKHKKTLQNIKYIIKYSFDVILYIMNQHFLRKNKKHGICK